MESGYSEFSRARSAFMFSRAFQAFTCFRALSGSCPLDLSYCNSYLKIALKRKRAVCNFGFVFYNFAHSC